jgi:hypothetical protein
MLQFIFKVQAPLKLICDYIDKLYYELFKNLNSALHDDDVELRMFSEILTCIKKLKNDKASGDDMVRNEFIKSTSDVFLSLYVDLFNLILKSGIIPDTWIAGNIVPFYKNKEAKTDPKNFPPITILSCFGKLFRSVMNNRLKTFSDEFLLFNENPTGLRKKYTMLDNIFVIYI